MLEDADGWAYLSQGSAINDRGQIVGQEGERPGRGQDQQYAERQADRQGQQQAPVQWYRGLGVPAFAQPPGRQRLHAGRQPDDEGFWIAEEIFIEFVMSGLIIFDRTYRRLIEIGDYYEDRQIKVSTQLTDIKDFESFVANELKQDLLALWMGRKSLLDRFYPRDWVGRFVSKCQTSVLVMR